MSQAGELAIRRRKRKPAPPMPDTRTKARANRKITCGSMITSAIHPVVASRKVNIHDLAAEPIQD